MSMHQGLDLSRFKKVSSDKKSTTLRHAKGHEIRVAHSGLTPKMREHIESLPQHEETEVKRYKDGGGVTKDDEQEDVEAIDPDSPASADGTETPPPEPTQAAPEPAAPQAPEPSPLAEVAQPQAAPAPAPAPQQVAPTPKPAVMPTAGTVDVVAPAPKPTPQMVAQEMTNHDLAFQQDLAMGHVKPETYQSLYAKKDTLGKIGTLFGLLVSGAGAGLTHQPNAVLEMMNKEIQNDFEAQKNSQSNSQNWYQMTRNHELQKAQMEQMQFQNMNTLANVGLTQANTGKVPAEIRQIESATRKNAADTDLIAQNAALIKMKMGAVQSLQDQANKLPPGPQKDQYQNAVNLLSNAVQQDAAKSNLETVSKIEAREKLRNAAQPAETEAHDPGIDMDKLNRLVAESRANANIGIEGKVNEADLGKIDEEAKQLAANREAARQYTKAFKTLDAAFAGSKLNPKLYESQVAAAKTEISRALTGAYSPSHAEEIAKSAFPDYQDFGGARNTKYQTFMGVLDGNESRLTHLNRLGLRKPFPFKKDGKATQDVAKGKKKYPEGTKMNGYIVQGGKWVKETAPKQASK